MFDHDILEEVTRGNLDAVKAVVQADPTGFKSNDFDDIFGVAVNHRQFHIVKYALENGAYPLCQYGYFGESCCCGDSYDKKICFEMLKYLVGVCEERNLDISCFIPKWVNVALVYSNYEVVIFLLDLGDADTLKYIPGLKECCSIDEAKKLMELQRI